MTDTLKAVAWCLAAQAMFMAGQALAPVAFADVSVLGAVALSCLLGGLGMMVVHWPHFSGMLRPGPVCLAVLSGALMLVLSRSLELAGGAATDPDILTWLAVVSVPLFTLILMMALRRESADVLRLACIGAGTAGAVWLLAGANAGGHLADADVTGLLQCLGAGMAVAGGMFLAKELAASVPAGPATAMILLGAGGVAAAVAVDELPLVIESALATPRALGAALGFTVVGIMLGVYSLVRGLTGLGVSTVGASWSLIGVLALLKTYALDPGTMPDTATLAVSALVLATFLGAALRERLGSGT